MNQYLSAISALNDPFRLTVIVFLEYHGECCVCELEHSLGATQSRLSRNLKILKDGGFLDVHRSGKWAYYFLAPQHEYHSELIKQVAGLGIDIPEKVQACEIIKEESPLEE